MGYIQEIAAFTPYNRQEANDQKIMLEFIHNIGDKALRRESEIAHITSSGFILNHALDRVLMVHHNIRCAWAWTGGHADGQPNLLEVALREAEEETGAVSLEPLARQMVSVDILPVNGHEKNGRYVSAHLHLNVAYLLVCDGDAPLRVKPDENTAVEWFDFSRFTEACFSAADVYLYNKLIERALSHKTHTL